MNDSEEYISCKYLSSGINFYFKSIRACNKAQFGPELAPFDKSGNVDLETIKKARLSILADLKNDKLPSSCIGCLELEKKKGNDSAQIKYMEIFHWLHCNCSCIYCANLEDTRGRYSSKVKKGDYYKLYPVLKKMFKDKIFAEDLEVSFVGGEPTVLEEFPAIVDLFLSNKITKMNILTSGISYSKAIHKALKKGAIVCTSLDSYTPEMYLKIKRVNEFHNVVNNIKKYILDPECAQHFWLKYIILDKINDTEEDLNKWLELAHSLGVKNIELSIEFCSSVWKKHGEAIPANYYTLFDFAYEKAKEYNLNVNVIPLVKNILAKGHY